MRVLRKFVSLKEMFGSGIVLVVYDNRKSKGEIAKFVVGFAYALSKNDHFWNVRRIDSGWDGSRICL